MSVCACASWPTAPVPEIKKRAKAPKAKAAPAKKSPAKKGAAKKDAKPKKDPNAPKRGLSAFMFFSSDNRGESHQPGPGTLIYLEAMTLSVRSHVTDKIKKEHPDCSFGEVGKYLGEAWGKCSAADKKKYEEKAAKDKARYEKEMAKYKK